MTPLNLTAYPKVLVKQRHELGEWVGFETRNKFEITDESGRSIGFAAEQQKGLLGFLLRQFLGHWRTFEIHVFGLDRHPALVARQPFRFIFQRLEVFGTEGEKLGAIQQRFAILSKRFDVEDRMGQVIMEVSSPLLKFWTFPFVRGGAQVACVQKKWTGLLAEAFTDKDTFLVDFSEGSLPEEERSLVLAAALFIDLRYFERKAR
ncbi:MAG TPA: phospholipid scramblase-related protein [Bdellovibrionota bacterium]|nr:phospholipid scramblase-related protein [Bdellovibrionota bacterium]